MNDLEIARIGAALQIVNDNERLSTDPMVIAAEDFLKRQFAPPEPKMTSQEFVRRNLVPDTRCTKIRPGRTTKLEDALRCSRQAGHEGPCDFANVLSQEQ
jgi:hypothetical protein